MAILANAKKFYNQLRPKPGRSSNPVDWTVAASQTLQMKDFVKLSTGKLAIAITPSGSADTAVLNGSGVVIVGTVLQGITTDSGGIATDGTGRTKLAVASVNDNEYMLGIYNATAGSAEPQDIVRGTNYELAVLTGSAATFWTWTVATSTTNAIMTYIEASPESAADEDYGFGWFSVIAADRIGA